MKRIIGLLAGVFIIATLAWADTIILQVPETMNAFSDRDGNVYVPSRPGRTITVNEKYLPECLHAGLTRQPKFTFANSTTATGTCVKGATRVEAKNLQVCSSSNVDPGWKKIPLK